MRKPTSLCGHSLKVLTETLLTRQRHFHGLTGGLRVIVFISYQYV